MTGALVVVGAAANRGVPKWGVSAVCLGTFAQVHLAARRWRFLRCRAVSALLGRSELIAGLTAPLSHSLRPQSSQQCSVLTVIDPVAHSFHDEKAHNQREQPLKPVRQHVNDDFLSRQEAEEVAESASFDHVSDRCKRDE